MTDKKLNITITIICSIVGLAAIISPITVATIILDVQSSITTRIDTLSETLTTNMDGISQDVTKIVAVLIDKDIIEYPDYYSSLCCPWTGDTV